MVEVIFSSLIIQEKYNTCMMVRGSKKRDHPAAASTSGASTSVETSTTPVEMASTSASIPPRTSLSPAGSSTPLGTSTPSVAASTPSAALTLFPQPPYSSTGLLLRLHLVWGCHRCLPLHHQYVHRHLPLHLPLYLPLHPRNFNKQSECAKVIAEIMKAYFVESHSSFGKVPNRMKNILCLVAEEVSTGPDTLVCHSGRFAETGFIIIQRLDAGVGKDEQGLRNVGIVCPTASAEGTVGRYTIRPILGNELKANTERLHTKTGSPIPIHEQLMIEASSGSNKRNVYGFGSQSATVIAERRRGNSSSMSSIPLMSFAAQERFDGFMTSFASQCGVQPDSVPTLFPPFPLPEDNTTSQPPTGPPSSSLPPPRPPPSST
ncbi:hypothetical protein M9H77_27927 [Catharanthus roseus]|uniref:Uncharacterized protein n=1 Tax=Catharanthus roseus TaxID=4058 RepID=A0ACC0AES5_CATRO|nr:hypothetical protein M9H77_27927 [Catharanthus roseus]